jgi:hypothetical protein
MTPTTEPAKRIATLFHRRLTTPWSTKEIAAYKKLYKSGCFNELDDLRLIECYYIFQRKKDDGLHRRDLATFLNNFHGELDRAREWNARNQRASGYTVRKENNGEKPATEEDFKRVSELAKAEIAKLKAQLRHQGSGILT